MVSDSSHHLSASCGVNSKKNHHSIEGKRWPNEVLMGWSYESDHSVYMTYRHGQQYGDREKKMERGVGEMEVGKGVSRNRKRLDFVISA